MEGFTYIEVEGMRAYTAFSLLLAVFLITFAGFYFSETNRASRAYQSMLEDGHMDLQIIDTYIRTRETPDLVYYQALNLAALLDDHYLEKVVALYARAQIMLKPATAERILSLLPSESITVNTAAGRMMAGSDYGHEDPKQAVHLLEYSALRGDRDAAEYLSDLYRRFDCPIAAANWAQVSNERDRISACSKIIIEPAAFSGNDWRQIVDNKRKIKDAWGAETIPVLEYSEDCVLSSK